MEEIVRIQSQNNSNYIAEQIKIAASIDLVRLSQNDQ